MGRVEKKISEKSSVRMLGWFEELFTPQAERLDPFLYRVGVQCCLLSSTGPPGCIKLLKKSKSVKLGATVM